MGSDKHCSNLSLLNSDEILFVLEEFSIDIIGATLASFLLRAKRNRYKAFVTDTKEIFLVGLVGAAEKEDLAGAEFARDASHFGNL